MYIYISVSKFPEFVKLLAGKNVAKFFGDVEVGMFKHWSFKRCSSVLLALISIFASTGLSGAQQFGNIPFPGNVNTNSLRVTPFAQIGYKFIGLNYNLPVNGFNGIPNALDLALRDAGVWMGAIGFDAGLGSRFLMSLRADANANKDIRVLTEQNFDYDHGIQLPWNWSGSQLQWWDIDGMLGYKLVRDWAILLGLRYDKLTVKLSNPVDGQGNSINYYFSYESENDTRRYWGDLNVQTWIPYIGLQFDATNYKAQLLYSPLASPQVRVPSRMVRVSNFWGHETLDHSRNLAGTNWNFTRTGSFLEAYLEYKDVSLSKNIQFGLWTRCTWMRSRGGGEWNYSDYWAKTKSGVDSAGYWNDAQSATGSLSSYGISFGISASFSMF